MTTKKKEVKKEETYQPDSDVMVQPPETKRYNNKDLFYMGAFPQGRMLNTANTFNVHLINPEHSDKPSETIQEHTMSLHELVERFTRPGVTTLQPVWQLDADGNGEILPDIEKMGIHERLDLARSISEGIVKMRADLARKKEHSDEEKTLLELPKEVIRRLAEFASIKKEDSKEDRSNGASAKTARE